MKDQLREAHKAKLAEEGESASSMSKWTNPLETEDSDEEKDDTNRTSRPLSNKESLEDRVKAFLVNLNKEENIDQLVRFISFF